MNGQTTNPHPPSLHLCSGWLDDNVLQSMLDAFVGPDDENIPTDFAISPSGVTAFLNSDIVSYGENFPYWFGSYASRANPLPLILTTTYTRSSWFAYTRSFPPRDIESRLAPPGTEPLTEDFYIRQVTSWGEIVHCVHVTYDGFYAYVSEPITVSSTLRADLSRGVRESFEMLLTNFTENVEIYGPRDSYRFVAVPQSGLKTPPRKNVCRIARDLSSPKDGRNLPPMEECSPDEQNRRRKQVDQYRRDAKKQKNLGMFKPQSGVPPVFHPQGLFSNPFKIGPTPDFQEVIEGIRETAGKFSSDIPELTTLLKNISTQGLSVHVGFDKSTIHVPALVGLASVAYMAKTEGGKWKAALAVYATGYVSSCTYQHRSWLTDRFSRIFGLTDEVRPQGADYDLIEDVSGAILGYLALVSAKAHLATPARIASIVKSLSSFDRAKTGIASAMVFSVRLVERLINWFRDQILGLPALSLLQSTIPVLQSWTSKVDIVVDEAHKGLLTINSANSQRLHSLVMEGNQLSTKKFGASDAAQVRSALTVYMATLRKLVIPFDQANFAGNGARMEPIVVLLSGKPGTGKTWSLLPLIMEVLRRVLPADRLLALKDDFNNEIFSRFPETKYWEGYRGQMACIFDDFGQARDVAGQPDNEFLELIRSANIFPYLLHMAGIEAKGCTNFNSRLIFCTTNLTSFTPQSISEPAAVMRRFDIILSVYPKAQFCVDPSVDRESRVLDKSLLGDRFDEDIYEFCLKSAQGLNISSEIKEILSFGQLRDRIVELYTRRSKVADDYIADLADRASTLLTPVVNQGVAPSVIQMEEIEEFHDTFDVEVMPPPLDPNVSLESILGPQVPTMDQDQRLMQTHEFGAFMSFLRIGLNFDLIDLGAQLTHAGYSSNYIGLKSLQQAARRYPAAFRECVDGRRDLLVEFVLRAFPPGSPFAVDAVEDESVFEHAKNLLKEYSVRVKDFMSSLIDKYSWLTDWKKVLPFLSAIAYGCYYLMGGPSIAKVVNNILGPDFLRSSILWRHNPELMPSDPDKVLIKFRPEASVLTPMTVSEDVTKAFSTLHDEIDGFKVTSHRVYMEDGWPWAEIEYTCESGGPRDKSPKFVVSKLKSAAKAEGGIDQTAQSMLDKAIKKSLYRITIPGYGDQQLGFMVFLKGKVAVMPHHFVSELKHVAENILTPESVVHIRNISNDSLRAIKLGDLLVGVVEDEEFSKHDAVLVALPDMHQHPDIVSYFITEKQLTFQQIRASLHGLRTDPNEAWSSSLTARRNKEQFVTADNGGYVVKETLLYQAATQGGDCGSLLVAQSPGFGPGKFLGFHVAGSEAQIGFSTVLTQEILNEALIKIPEPHNPMAPPTDVIKFFGECAPFPVPGAFVPLKTIDQVVSQPTRSKIVPSVLHNEWTVSPYAPPRLRPFETDGGVVDPALLAIERYGNSPGMVDKEPLVLAADFVAGKMLPLLLGDNAQPPRILTFDEAVLGLPEEEYCKSIPRNTSAGYPYILKETPGCRGKERFFGKGQDFDLTGKECVQLRKECDDIIEKARRGERSEVVYVDFLKDETRKHHRVAAGHTRLISAAPVAYTIVCRMYFLAFVMAVMSSHLLVSVGVGINCYSSDWDLLAKLLLSKGNHIVAGDFIGFDTSHYEFIANLVLKIIQRYYSGCEPLVRDVLFCDLTNSVHIIKDIVYMWCSGNLPSGHPLTAVFSSIINYILYVACWVKLHPYGAAGLAEYSAKVYGVKYGDDSIISIHPSVIGWFNYHTISKAMKSFGYNYTDEMKVGEGVGPLYRTLDQVTFLKRGFRFEPALGRYVAPLALPAILEMLYWTKRGHSGPDITRTNIENALRELSLHDRRTFDEWAPKIIESARERLNFHPTIVDYSVLQRITCGLRVVW